jgi:hypothetical protein
MLYPMDILSYQRILVYILAVYQRSLEDMNKQLVHLFLYIDYLDHKEMVDTGFCKQVQLF